MIYAYLRVSTEKQTLENQRVGLKNETLLLMSLSKKLCPAEFRLGIVSWVL